MWLTRLLLTRRSTPGRMFGGKNRLIRKITATQRKNSTDREKQVANVERLLSMPYLTAEEEHGHTAERRKQERTEFLIHRKRSRNLGPNVYAVDTASLTDKSKAILDHLNATRTQHGNN